MRSSSPLTHVRRVGFAIDSGLGGAGKLETDTPAIDSTAWPGTGQQTIDAHVGDELIVEPGFTGR